jgi:hypothetical protein
MQIYLHEFCAKKTPPPLMLCAYRIASLVAKMLATVAPGISRSKTKEIRSRSAQERRLPDSPMLIALNVAAPRVAVMRRAARAARAVSMARAMNLALDNNTVAVVAVVAMHEHGEDGGDEEEDDVPGNVVSSCTLQIVHRLTYMMPNAQLALSIAHWRSTLSPYFSPLTVKSPRSVLYDPFEFHDEQSASAMPRSSYTAPMKAPMNSRSTNATNLAECLAFAYKKRVPRAHAAPRTEMMKRTRMERGVRRDRVLYQSTNQASMPSVGIRVRTWKMRQNQKDRPEMDMVAVVVWCLCRGLLVWLSSESGATPMDCRCKYETAAAKQKRRKPAFFKSNYRLGCSLIFPDQIARQSV